MNRRREFTIDRVRLVTGMLLDIGDSRMDSFNTGEAGFYHAAVSSLCTWLETVAMDDGGDETNAQS